MACSCCACRNTEELRRMSDALEGLSTRLDISEVRGNRGKFDASRVARLIRAHERREMGGPSLVRATGKDDFPDDREGR